MEQVILSTRRRQLFMTVIRDDKALTIVGAQWGDEGKGKIVDLLTEDSHLVVRFHGGNNAGHTLVVGGITTKLHLIPSGILRRSTRCLIGAGVVLEPQGFADEVTRLRQAGINVSPERLIVDGRTELVLPYHRRIDNLRESGSGGSSGGVKIGTTGRGIGPCYEDRAARCGVRVAELRALDTLRSRLVSVVEQKNLYMTKVLGDRDGVSFATIWESIEQAVAEVLPFCGDGSEVLLEAKGRGEKVVFEGAQGVLLDPIFGTVPFVTSSSTLPASIASGCGVTPEFIGTIFGVTKAYSTRVGEGPFPTELQEETGEFLRQQGSEFGTTTGRARRCGWLDMVLLRYAIKISGISQLIITKLDVLSGLSELKIACSYTLGEQKFTDNIPMLADELSRVGVEYIQTEGWNEDISGARRLSDLPDAARRYLSLIADLAGVPVSIVSVGPDRDQTIMC